MAGQYAKDTTVSTDQSRNEIERTLRRYGADAFMYASEASTVGQFMKPQLVVAYERGTMPTALLLEGPKP